MSATHYRSFTVHADRTINDLQTGGHHTDPTLYDDLIRAGFPFWGGTGDGDRSDIVVLIDGGKVLAQTAGHDEWDMGSAGVLFLGWLRTVGDVGVPS